MQRFSEQTQRGASLSSVANATNRQREQAGTAQNRCSPAPTDAQSNTRKAPGSHMPHTVYDVLDELEATALSSSEKGSRFERLSPPTCAPTRHLPSSSSRFTCGRTG
jgi:hypothetical protein